MLIAIARFIPFYCSLLLGIALIGPNQASAVETAAATTAPAKTATAPPRPRIGLVLSGGGARGYAHLGVLDYLEKMRVPVDYIAATSMGALIGGLYASGIPADELLHRLSRTNLSDIAFDRNERAKLPQSQREDDFQYPISIAVGYDDGNLKTAPGLLQGNNLLTLLQNWTKQLPSDIAFDRLPIPFHAVATDLALGTKVLLDRGSLPQAMRASMAVPGLFAPFQIDGQTLVDGGLVGNLPVQEARDMGADVIIAVNIATPLQEPAALQSPTAVAQQMIGILIQQNVKLQKALLGPGDVLIEPHMQDISFADFARARDGVEAGWDAADRHAARLAELALPPAQWQVYLAGRATDLALPPETRIDAIEIRSAGPIPSSYVRSRLDVKEGDIYDVTRINQQLSQLAANGDFNTLRHTLVRNDGRQVVRIDAEEKSWGPQYLLFGLGLSNSFDGRGGFNLQLGHRYPWIDPSGLEWRNDLVLGNKQASLHSEFRQPVLGFAGMYVAPYLNFMRTYVDLYPDGSDPRTLPLTQYRIDNQSAGVDLGMPLARLGELRLGVNYLRSKSTPTYDYFGLLYPTTLTSQPAMRARLTVDQLDDPLFPRKGYYLFAEANRGFGGGYRRYSDLQVKTLWASGRDRHTLNVAFEAASNMHDNDTGPGFTLGGFQRLSAYAPDQFYGSYLLYGRLTYLLGLDAVSLPGLRDPVLGTSLEAGNIWQTRSAFGDGPYKKSVSLFLGGNSPVGPLYFGAALGQQGIWNLYLQLGRVF